MTRTAAVRAVLLPKVGAEGIPVVNTTAFVMVGMRAVRPSQLMMRGGHRCVGAAGCSHRRALGFGGSHMRCKDDGSTWLGVVFHPVGGGGGHGGLWAFGSSGQVCLGRKLSSAMRWADNNNA